jgi:hypothetical protein
MLYSLISPVLKSPIYTFQHSIVSNTSNKKIAPANPTQRSASLTETPLRFSDQVAILPVTSERIGDSVTLPPRMDVKADCIRNLNLTMLVRFFERYGGVQLLPR